MEVLVKTQGTRKSTARQNAYYLVVALAAMIVIFILATGRGNDSGASLKVGILAPLSSFMSGHGQSIEMGARLAASVINEEGGILGREIELVVLDTKSDPATAAERTKELISRDRVELIIGTGTSAETLAVISVASQAGVPFIYSLDGECKTCAEGRPDEVAKWIYGSGFTERMVVRPLFDTLSRKIAPGNKAMKVFFIGGDYVYPRTTNAFARSVAEELGHVVVGDEYSDTSTQDYAPVIRRIEESKADLLIVTNPGASGVTFMRQARQMELDKKLVISGFATFDQEALDAMGDASEGVYCINRYSNLLENAENRQFAERFRLAYPERATLPGPTAAAGSYGALIAAKEAYLKAKSFEKAAFTVAMNGLEVALPQGKIRINPDNHIFDQPIYVMQIRNRRYEIVETIPQALHPGFKGCSVK
jgi:ABC-type branched-subunit amino acid transport system substrate-binding protein